MSKLSTDTEGSSDLESKKNTQARSCMIVRTLDDSLHRKKDSILRERARYRRYVRLAGAAGITIHESLHRRTIDDSSTYSCSGRVESFGFDDPLNVSFDSVNIREYPVTLGDNPGVSAGPSLTIDWKPQSEVEIPLDEYETNRPPRRDYMEMSIPKDVRMEMLQNSGHTKKEIMASVRSTNIGRHCRKKTNAMAHMHDTHEAIEDVYRALRHVVTFKKHKKKERALIQLSDEFQKKRAEEAIQAENEASEREVMMLKELEVLKEEIDRKRAEAPNFPPTHVSEEKDQVSECADNIQKHEEVEVHSEETLNEGSKASNNIERKLIISCEEA